MPDQSSTTGEMLAYWKSLAGDPSPEPWASENMGMFFQGFRPHGHGVEAAFEGVAAADEILPRLLEVYAATAEGGENDAYFVVRAPEPLSGERAMELAVEYIRKTAQIARELGATGYADGAELLEMLHSRTTIEVVPGERPWPPHRDSPEGLVYQVVGDYMSHLQWDLEPIESHAYEMEEGLYTLACDYGISYHILWPLYRHLTEITEPFAAYFELWKHGAGHRFEDDGAVRIYVPNLVP
jgi:hypothetical protein